MTDALQYLVTNGYPESTPHRVLPDGRLAWVHQLMFTHAILVSHIGECGFHDRWCFADKALATDALTSWGGTEPEGWHRHPRTGRRRPDGDASREYVEM